MKPFTFDIRTAYVMVSFMYLLMPVTVWLVLRGRHDRTSLMVWCGGSTIYGLGYLLIGLRGLTPDWLSIYAANALVLASYPLRVASLRMEGNARVPWPALAAWWAVTVAAYIAAASVSVNLRLLTATVLNMVGGLGLAGAALWVWRRMDFVNARTIAVAYAAFAAAALHLCLRTGFDDWEALIEKPSLSLITVVLAGSAAAVYGSLGFMGLSTERVHRRDLAQSQELAAESAQRLAAEQHAEQLRTWLDEREELLRLLAHEVRQPLNNASAALQAAHSALARNDPHPGTAHQRVQRAEAVLGQIIGTLDNTLAATALLASPDRVQRRDADIAQLADLSLGDLEATQRPRVTLEKLTPTRTATLDAGLLRLALRNLLGNALLYSPAGTPVVLRITESDEPLALVFEVLDRGPGIEPALAQSLFERGVRGSHANPGHGLGLYVVRRVMELHGGTVDLRPNRGGGTVFRLVVPQGLA